MTQEELKHVLKLHTKWILNNSGGVKADLRGANLEEANLREADLRRADLRNANLRGADLRNTNLRGADLRKADLRETDLRGAYLREADLRGANMDFSCLPLLCGGRFKAGNRICKQLVAHVVQIMELSEIDEPELIKAMKEYKTGWHRE